MPKKDRLHTLYKWLRSNPIASINALDLLDQHGLMTTGEIAGSLDLSRGVVSKLIKSLESKGWVSVKETPKDRRVRTVALTTIGKRELDSRVMELETIIGRIS